MKKLIVAALVFGATSSLASASELHKIALGVNYHLDQKSAPGIQAAYQWQFSDTFEFDARLVTSNDLEVNTHQGDMFGDYQQFSIGGNFLKRYNDDLTIKAGTGLGFIFSSDNKQLVSDSAMAPYVMLGLNYQLSNNVALEFGQFSHFNSEQLGTNHSIYLNVSVQFGRSNKLFRTLTSDQPQAVTEQESIETQSSQAEMTQPSAAQKAPLAATVASPADKMINGSFWYVQFGAYHNHSNAQNAINKFQRGLPDIQLAIVKHKQYFRVVSRPFESKQRADDHASMVNSRYSLSGYVTQLK